LFVMELYLVMAVCGPFGVCMSAYADVRVFGPGIDTNGHSQQEIKS